MNSPELADTQWDWLCPLLPPGALRFLEDRLQPVLRPDSVAGDKDYSSPAVRRYLRGRRVAAVIPTKADQEPLLNSDRPPTRSATWSSA